METEIAALPIYRKTLITFLEYEKHSIKHKTYQVSSNNDNAIIST